MLLKQITPKMTDQASGISKQCPRQAAVEVSCEVSTSQTPSKTPLGCRLSALQLLLDCIELQTSSSRIAASLLTPSLSLLKMDSLWLDRTPNRTASRAPVPRGAHHR